MNWRRKKKSKILAKDDTKSTGWIWEAIHIQKRRESSMNRATGDTPSTASQHQSEEVCNLLVVGTNSQGENEIYCKMMKIHFKG